MRLLAFALVLPACSNDMPPPISDSDASFHEYADATIPPRVIDAGNDAGTVVDLDFEGACMSGYDPVWHFFDFQTHTPGTSSLQFIAFTAATEAALDTEPAVALATVTGPDITVWTGVDVAAALAGQKLQSLLFLRVRVVETPSTDSTMPVLVNYRQAFDCVIGQ